MKISNLCQKVSYRDKTSFDNIHTIHHFRWVQIIIVLLFLLSTHALIWTQNCTNTIWHDDFRVLLNGMTTETGIDKPLFYYRNTHGPFFSDEKSFVNFSLKKSCY
jgi:hypothetical protein